MIQSQSVARVVLGGMEGLAGAAADGVDEDVHAAEPLDGLATALGRVLLGDVGHDRQPLAAGRLDASQRRFERLGRPVDDGHARARAGQRLGKRRPDPAAAAGDHRHAAGQAEYPEIAHRFSIDHAARVSGSGSITSRTAPTRS